MNNSSIEIYRSPEGTVELDVKLENETVWLTQEQMSILFGRDRTVITKHINNCYKEGELDKNITCAKFAHVGQDGDQVYETQMYNLDVIISVGYRVKSVNGTRFRQWANKILKDYLIKGYTINKNITAERYNELKDMVRIMSRTISLQSNVSNDEYSGLFNVISDYIYALDIFLLILADVNFVAIVSVHSSCSFCAGKIRASFSNGHNTKVYFYIAHIQIFFLHLYLNSNGGVR